MPRAPPPLTTRFSECASTGNQACGDQFCMDSIDRQPSMPDLMVRLSDVELAFPESIHNPSAGINSRQRTNVVLYRSNSVQERPVSCRFEAILRDDDRSALNPFVYRICFSCPDAEWYVLKTYNELALLFEYMAVVQTKRLLPRLHRGSLSHLNPFVSDISCLLTKPVILLSSEEARNRIPALCGRLQDILHDEFLRSTNEFQRFAEISQYSFRTRLGDRVKECMVKRRTGGYQRSGCFCIHKCFQWRSCWLIVKPSFVAYANYKDESIHGLLMLDPFFRVKLKMAGKRQLLEIRNSCRTMVLKCTSHLKMVHLYQDLTRIIGNCEYSRPHRYGSFAPVREGTFVKWLVDGAVYFESLADMIERAEKQIFITDWFLSPELYLKRPAIDNRYRLDSLLFKKADSGVMIYILLYKEFELVMGINSAYSKRKLMRSHRNIKVLRYPDHVKPTSPTTVLWTNHEKSIIIDQSFALLGGLDICYGRWDDCTHRLSDLGPSHVPNNATTDTKNNLNEPKHSNMVSNDSIPKFKHSRKNAVPSIKKDLFLPMEEFLRKSTPDYSGVVVWNGPSESSLHRRANSSIDRQRAISVTNDDNHNHSTVHPLRYQCLSLESGLDMSTWKLWPDSMPNWVTHRMTHSLRRRLKEKMLCLPRIFRPFQYSTSSSMQNHDDDSMTNSNRNSMIALEGAETIALNVPDPGEHFGTNSIDTMINRFVNMCGYRLWVGKDYCNIVVKDFRQVDDPFEDLIDRHQLPRMPWHDVGVAVEGDAAGDIARHFIQRWNFVKKTKFKNDVDYPILLPEQSNPVKSWDDGEPTRLRCIVQVLRSAGAWSTGISKTERSINQAYLHAIAKSEHYIYIENQFFICGTKEGGSTSPVKNQILDALFDRLCEAVKKDETFRLFVVLPLMPGFEGSYGSANGTAIQAITHWNYRSISHGPDSLIARMCAIGCDPFKYISFCALRNWANLKDRLVTEMIYVHSKVMIVDDRIVLIGSANLNDRSLLGNRDSELAVSIADTDFTITKMNGKTTQVGKFASSLRIRLMREHLGLMSSSGIQDIDMDPVSDRFFLDIWLATAALNTMIYEKVFNCIPSNEATDFQILRQIRRRKNLATSDPKEAMRMLGSIRGYLVLVPLKFLQNEHLLPGILTKESLVPAYFWT